MSALEIRLAFYGVLLAAICGGFIYERIHGEDLIKAQDKAARAAQKVEDEKVSEGVINDLKTKLASIPPYQPPPVVRLCVPTRSVRETPSSSGTKPAVASTTGEGSGGVSQGTTGLDVGGELQNLERSSEIIAIYRDSTWKWSVKSGIRPPTH